MSSQNFLAAIEARRSIYGIGKDVMISDDKIQAVVKHAVKHTPSAFNSQSSRVVVLLGDQHSKLWSITTETLRKIVPAEDFTSTQERMNAFGNGYGTVLFFEDEAVIESLQENFTTYKEKFPEWSLQSSGMVQFVVWTALELEGLGASLQHYNPLIDDAVKEEWSLPASWKLLAQMPFGNPLAPPYAEKEFQPIDTRVKVMK